MRIRDSITTPGGSKANEDRVGHAGDLAWVIDGATDLHTDSVLGAGNDVLWLVDFVTARLSGHASGRPELPDGPALLAVIADEVEREMARLGFPPGRLPPACSLAILVDRGDRFETTRIGDATAVLAGARPAVLDTDFFDHREATAVGVRDDRASSPAEVTAAMGARRLHTMTAGDRESVFSGHPLRRLRPHTVSGSWRDVHAVLLCTDGFARLVTDHGLYDDWAAVVSDARAQGLAYLEKVLRDAEASGRPVRRSRFKAADDVAALLATPT